MKLSFAIFLAILSCGCIMQSREATQYTTFKPISFEALIGIAEQNRRIIVEFHDAIQYDINNSRDINEYEIFSKAFPFLEDDDRYDMYNKHVNDAFVEDNLFFFKCNKGGGNTALIWLYANGIIRKNDDSLHIVEWYENQKLLIDGEKCDHEKALSSLSYPYLQLYQIPYEALRCNRIKLKQLLWEAKDVIGADDFSGYQTDDYFYHFTLFPYRAGWDYIKENKTRPMYYYEINPLEDNNIESPYYEHGIAIEFGEIYVNVPFLKALVK